jgi:hypothetical protein
MRYFLEYTGNQPTHLCLAAKIQEDDAKGLDLKEVFGTGPYGSRALVQQIVQEVLETGMDDGDHPPESSTAAGIPIPR